MAKRTRRIAIALSLIVLLCGLGGGAYWIYKRGMKREGTYEKATRAFRQRDYVRAAELARKVLVAEPNRQIAQELLIEALIRAELYDDARTEAQRYADKGKEFARVTLCRLAIQRGDMVVAERIARALTDTEPAFAHHILALLSDNYGIATNNWQLRLGAASTMRGLAALTDREAVRATAFLFCSQITLEVAAHISGGDRLIKRAREDLQSATVAIEKAYQTDHAYPYELNMGLVNTLSANETDAALGAKTLRKYISGVQRSEDVIATLAMYHLRRNEMQEAIDLINDLNDMYLWNRVFWVLTHGGHRDVALRVLEQAADADKPAKRLMRGDILLKGDKAEDKAAGVKILAELIKDQETDTAAVLRALVILTMRADLDTARDVAASANLEQRDDKRIKALLAFLLNTDEANKSRALEIARDLAEDINTVAESRDMLYLLGGGSDVMNSYLDAQVAKGGESGLQHRLRRALNNMGLARREADSEKGKQLRAEVVADVKAVLIDKGATKGSLVGAFSIASSIGETDLAGQVMARALAMPGAPDLLRVRILELAFRTTDQKVVAKLSDGVRKAAADTRAPAFIGVFADLMLSKGEITNEHIDRLDTAAKADEGSRLPSLELACRMAIGKNLLERGEGYARAIIKADPQHAVGRQLLGAVLMRGKAYDKVLALYKGIEPLPQEGHYQCVAALEQLGRKEEALKLARKALAKFPRAHVSYVVLAQLHLDRKETAKALAVLNVAPPNTFVLLMKAELLVRLKDYRMAERLYEALLYQTQFLNQIAWAGLHEALVKQDRAQDFISITSGILAGKTLKEDAPIRATVHILRGQTLEGQGKVQEALSDYEEAIKRNESAWSALNNAAWHISQLAPARIADARKYIDRALKIRPNEPALLDTAAEVYSVQGEHDLALKQIDSCLVVATSTRAVEYMLHKAKILLRAEREEEARTLLAKVQADFPDSPLSKEAKDIVWKLDLKNLPDEEEDKETTDDGE